MAAVSNRTVNANRRARAMRGGSLVDRMQKDLQLWNRHREHHNPVRGLTMQRAVSLLESYPRGEFADLMWTFGCPMLGIEVSDEDLFAIVGRRTDVLLEMDWNATPKSGDNVDDVLAEEQAAFIKETVERVENLYEAIEHLQTAFVRGFAHCEKVQGAGSVIRELRPVDQWNVVRDGLKGGWRYNPDARQTSFSTLEEEMDMLPEFFITHEPKRPLARIALVKFIRQSLTQKDWASFLEIYGMQTGVVFGPPDVPPEREAEYQDAAEAIATGGSGYLPHGSQYTPNPTTEGRGTSVYEESLRYWTERLVLAGTGGKLTMLAESGSGTLAGSAHQEVFEQLGRGDARRVSEAINTDFVIPDLQAAFPGQPILADWELAFREEVDGSKVIEDAGNLTVAGYRIDQAELEEKCGYKLERVPVEGEVDAEELDAEESARRDAAGKGGGGFGQALGISNSETDLFLPELSKKGTNKARNGLFGGVAFLNRLANALQRRLGVSGEKNSITNRKNGKSASESNSDAHPDNQEKQNSGEADGVDDAEAVAAIADLLEGLPVNDPDALLDLFAQVMSEPDETAPDEE